jgi:two-component system nitrate/nitrite response regulator NarL
MSVLADSRTRVLIAADRLPTRVGLRLALEPELECSEAADPDSAVAAAVRDRPDVCLLDFATSARSLDAATRIVSEVPSAGVILLTGRIDEDEFMTAVRVGASGYLPQSVDPARLPDVVRGVLRGEPAIPRRFVTRLIDELRSRDRRRSIILPSGERIHLTAREWEVVELLLRGATTAEIASELELAPVTVRRHFGSVERKLGVTTRAEVVRLVDGARPGF